MRRLLLALFLAMIALLGIAIQSGPSLTYRYRLTIEVDTPAGSRSGSSVIETTIRNNRELSWYSLNSRTFTARTHGEAVFVDLGSGRQIVALLARGKTGRADTAVREIVPLSLGARPYVHSEVWPAIISAVEQGRRADVPQAALPTFVTFQEKEHPASIEVIDPSDFSSVFGFGYRLSRVTVELLPTGWWPANKYGLSGIPLTHEIGTRIPEILRQVCEKDKQRRFSHPTGPYEPNMGHFMRGMPYRDSCARTL